MEGKKQKRLTAAPPPDFVQENTTDIHKIKSIILPYFSKYEKVKLLNVGAKGGLKNEFSWIQNLGKSTEVFELEYDMNYVQETEHSFFGDICSCPHVPSQEFDIVYIYNVFEHVKEPWEAAKECVRLCKPGGIIISGSPFAWYYHLHPVDFWRFSHKGLEYLFDRTGEVETMCLGFKEVCWYEKKNMPKTKGIQSIYICRKK